MALESLERLYLALGREEDLLKVLDTKLTLASDDDERRATQDPHRIDPRAARPPRGRDFGPTRPCSPPAWRTRPCSVRSTACIRASAATRSWAGSSSASSRSRPRTTSKRARTCCSASGILKHEQLESPDEGDRALSAGARDRPGARGGAGRGWRPGCRSRREEEDSDRSRQRVDVSRILLPIYERMGAHAEQVQCLDIQANAAEDTLDRVTLRLRQGEILSQAMGDSGAAFEAYAAGVPRRSAQRHGAGRPREHRDDREIAGRTSRPCTRRRSPRISRAR